MAVEPVRICGYRKIGGIYLEGAPGPGYECGALPFQIKPCPHCLQYPKWTRGTQKIRPLALRHSMEDCKFKVPAPGNVPPCEITCPLREATAGQVGCLIWIGKSLYPVRAFLREARTLGVSRRLPSRQKFLRPGKTWVFVAHPAGMIVPCGYAFLLKRIVKLIPDDLPTRDRAKLTRQGLELVEIPPNDRDHQPTHKRGREKHDQGRLDMAPEVSA
jgi:hypothetical protein